MGVYNSLRTIEFEEVRKEELPYLLSSKLNQPTSAYPVYYSEANTVRVFPSDYGTSVTIDYLTLPQDPIWGYTTGGNGELVYSSGTSQDFEIHESDETDLVMKILAYTGIIIKDPTVIQSAAQKEVNDFNQDNL